MRKINAIITPILLILFIIHGVAGACSLLGYGNPVARIVAGPMFALVCVHAIIGVVLTVQTLAAQKKAGTAYLKENRLFWARRISGLLIPILMGFHIFVFTNLTPDYRLKYFGSGLFFAQLLLVVTVMFHVMTNVRPSLIALGVPKLQPKVNSLLFGSAVLLVFLALGFILFYVRWYMV